MLARSSNLVTMAETGLSMRNKEGDCAPSCVVQDGLQASRILSGESLVSSFTSDASSTLTEQVECESGRDARLVALSPVSGIKESNLDCGVRLGTEMSETLRFRQVFGEVSEEESGLEPPVSRLFEEKTCRQERTPTDSMLISAFIVSSEKENPGSLPAPESDLHALRSITRAPMKPARMSLFNQTVRSSSVRRRLNFDGL